MKPNCYRQLQAFTLIEIMIVVAIIGMLMAIVIPNVKRAIEKSRRVACQANLKQIQGAKVEWALDHRRDMKATPTDEDLFGPGKYLEAKPECQSGGAYTVNAMDGRATCSVASHTL